MSSRDVAPLIDAYCHVGLPRFGSVEDAMVVLDQAGVDRVVFVLGPGVPDYGTLFHALRRYGDRVRGIGIPFGETDEQVVASVELQLRAGVLGLRLEPQALFAYPRVLTQLGERGRWVYAIGASSSPMVVRVLLNWLAAYPEAKVAAPHFLKPCPRLACDVEREKDEAPLRDLVAHPRFYPIFSRHGGMGSQHPYPHADFRLWVEQVIEAAGWDHVLWGSEYPVLYWRNETMVSCRGWLAELLPALTPAQRRAYLGDNAQRVIFDAPAPPVEEVEIPAWVEAQFNRDRTVPLFPQGLEVPMSFYASLHHRYVKALQDQPDLTFATFVAQSFKESGLV